MKNCGFTQPRIHVWLADLCMVSVHGKFYLSIPLSVAEKGMRNQKSIISSKDTGLLRPKSRASLSDRVFEVR